MNSRILFASLLLGATFAHAEEVTKEVSTSPDRRFAILRVFDEKDDASPFFRIVERKSKLAVGRIPTEGQAATPEEARFLWAPGSKKLAYNYRAGGRYISTSLYQWKENAFVEAASPETSIGDDAIEQERQKQLLKLGLPKESNQRRIWDTWRIRRWPDANTATLLVHSIRTVPTPRPDATADIDVWIRFTLKFDEAGDWKVTKTYRLTEAEAGREKDE
jgi:hypothetical protein